MQAESSHRGLPIWGLRWVFLLLTAAIWGSFEVRGPGFWGGIGILVAIGLLPMFWPAERRPESFDKAIILLDTLIVGLLLALGGGPGSLAVAFLVIVLAMATASGRSARLVLALAALPIYAWAAAVPEALSLIGPLAFLTTTAVYFGALAERSERREQIGRVAQKERRELWTLLEISDTISATLDLKQLMSVIVERVAGLMGSTSCSILMTDEKMREGVVVAAHENHEIDMLSVDLEKYPEIRRAVETREPVVIQDVRSDPTIAAVRETLLAKGYQSALVIPLVFGSEVMGALFLRTKRTTPFDEREIRFCKVVAGASANALKNALLYQEMTLQAERHRTIGETLRCILNATPDLILATDAAGQVTEVNNGAENLLGLDRVDIDGHTVREVLALDEEQNIGHPVHVDGGIEQRETMILREGGGTLEMHVLQAPLRDAEGARAGDVWIGRDISRLRKTERSLAQAERLSSLGEIVAGVAHELNNPLSGVVGYAELLQGTVSEENVLHDLERIVESSRRCQKIVMNLLSFSRKHKAEKARHDLNYCVEKVLELKEYHLRANTILPVLELEAQLPSTRFDFHQIEQVVLNLIQNAEQAIRSTGNGGSIAMRTYQEGDYLVLEVEDDGPGIEDEVRDRVFDPFFTTKDIGEGTGLGLSVSFGIVQEHGGELELAESEEGKGACFRLRLPWVRPAENELDNQPAGLEDGDCTPLYGARILIVDDEEVIRELMFRVLREHGARVQVAGDGLEAWELIAQQEFDLVVTDIRMPNLDGQSLYERVVEVRPELMSRFVFSTGDTIRPETMEFLENVHNRILTKPLQPETVRQVLSRALES